MLSASAPALVLAPMQGLTDAPMRAVQSEAGAFTFAVSEFLRISSDVPSRKMFYRHVPELYDGGRTPGGLPVQVQLLGGHAGRMAQAALVAVRAGAGAIDINFGCPAPTVNRHDGGAMLLNFPERIREIVGAVREAVPTNIPVSAKLRLGWDTLDAIHVNADMAAEGGADWITIHGRTRAQGYRPPAYWNPIGQVRERLTIPVVANGDIWTLDDFRRCRDETGCGHFMLGRGALANPHLASQVAHEMGLLPTALEARTPADWTGALMRLVHYTAFYERAGDRHMVCRLKQWLSLAARHGEFMGFDSIKRMKTSSEIFAALAPAPLSRETVRPQEYCHA